MPIVGLTDQPRRFVEVGQIRKGAPKPKNAQQPGMDLTYFRATFSEGEEEAARMFHEVYGEEPREIEVFLPFDEPEANFETWKEFYLAGGLTHRCDGEYVVYAVDPDSGEVLVQNGLDKDGGKVPCTGAIYYTDQKGQTQTGACKPEGRLKVIVPALRRLAFMTVITHSIWDIVNLSGELEGYWAENKQRLRGIRFVLKRRPKMISTPSGNGGKKARRKKWLLDIEPAPSWVEEQFLMLEQAARPKLEVEEVLQLPPGVPDTNGDDEEEVEGEVSYEIEGGGRVWEDEKPVYQAVPVEMPKFRNMNEFYAGVVEHFERYADKAAVVAALTEELGMTVLDAQKGGTTMANLWAILVELEEIEEAEEDDFEPLPF